MRTTGRIVLACVFIVALVAGCGDGGGGGTPDDVVGDGTGGDLGPDGTCTPSCDGKKCGPNGCGGTCGACGDNEKCSPAGQCVPDVSDRPCCNAVATPGCAADKTIETCVCKKDDSCCHQAWDADCVNAVETLGCGKCCAPACDGKECGDGGCPGQADACGKCTDGKTCKAGRCQACSCDGKQCGDDGCGTSCGKCDGGKACSPAGQCVEASACGVCLDGLTCDDDTMTCVGGACGDVTWQGKCEGGLVVYCDADKLYSADCGNLSDGKLECGLIKEVGAYDCVCKPQCDGKQCGNGGCADRPDACGTCGSGKTCEAGQCVACSCDGKDCGDDGCGTNCGTCGEGKACDPDHKCVDATECGVCPDGGTCGAGDNYDVACAANECGEVGAYGTCLGEIVIFCEDDVLYSLDCAYLLGAVCGYNPDGDFLDCVCPDGQHFVGGQCEPCTCDGRECGDDGCGKDCGSCGGGEFCDWKGACQEAVINDCCSPTPGPGCEADAAVEECVCAADPYCCETEWDTVCAGLIQDERCGVCCIPDCSGMECGDDGCGGQCGSCGEGEWCEAGSCRTCECGLRKCGFDECGNPCGTCQEGQYCSDTGACLPCSCDGKDCGDDGCGNACGTCTGGTACLKGACITPDFACCEPSDVAGCEADQAVADCVCGEDPLCCSDRWDEICVIEVDWLQCGICCVPDCKDRVCGEDGCGGSCGDCADGQGCNDDGQCVKCECLGGQECGTDTCGNPACGSCPSDQYCSPDNTCIACGCGSRECGYGPCDEECGACSSGWCDDGTCVAYTGDCCQPQSSAGCADVTIRECVCDHDPYCCQVEWDDTCVTKAGTYCQACN
ncbi:MAG: hypothetical protein FJ087_16530 [Deltaproteobacteria bacterium]|nr:hypothetical protein [Deltaproteobacteria bacterium]